MRSHRTYTRELHVFSLAFSTVLILGTAVPPLALAAPFGAPIPESKITPDPLQSVEYSSPPTSAKSKSNLEGVILTKLNIMEASGQLTPESAAKFRERFNQLVKLKSATRDKNKKATTVADAKLATELQALNSELDARRAARNTTAGWFNWF